MKLEVPGSIMKWVRMGTKGTGVGWGGVGMLCGRVMMGCFRVADCLETVSSISDNTTTVWGWKSKRTKLAMLSGYQQQVKKMQWPASYVLEKAHAYAVL